MAYANAPQARPAEILRELWGSVDPNDFQWTARGSSGVPATEVLLAYLRELETRASDEAWLFVEGQEALESELRSLRDAEEPSRASYRPEQGEQRSGEHSDALQALSRLLAHDCEKTWARYRRENALPHVGAWAPDWERGVPRVAHGVPDRVGQLRAYGNAVVPQIPELIGRAILASLEQAEAA